MIIRKLVLLSRCSRYFKRASALVLLLAGMQITTVQALPILQLDSDFQLHGATGVEIDGFSYNVRFIDSSCNFIWSGCNSSKFLFKTAVFANKASQALMNQVLLDFAPHLLFDTAPQAIAGIESAELAAIITPYALSRDGFVRSFTAGNFANERFDGTAESPFPQTTAITDEADSPVGVYARWSVASATSVPEPSVMLLMTSGLFAFGLIRKKARK